MGLGLGLPGVSFPSGGNHLLKTGQTKDRQKLDNNNFTHNNLWSVFAHVTSGHICIMKQKEEFA